MSAVNPIIIDSKAYASDAKAAYYAAIVAGWTGLVAHFGLMVFFFVFGIDSLGYVNIVSVAAWLVFLKLVGDTKIIAAMYVAGLEMTIHAIFAVAVLGTDYGFQLFLIAIACLLSVSPQVKVSSGWPLSIICLLLFVVLNSIFAPQTEYVFLADYSLIIYNVIFLVTTVSTVLGILMMKREYNNQREQLLRLAHYDMLTSLHNRRYFYHFLEEQLVKARHNGKGFCLAIADIDRFKSINDTYGHDAGDEVLVDVSQYLLEFADSQSIKIKLARWGGEEFVFCFFTDDIKTAQLAADKMRTELKSLTMTERHISTSMSVGLIKVDTSLAIEASIKLADELLYQAKAKGRDCTVIK